MDLRSFVEQEMRNIASSSSSASTPKWTYDVFLSFKGEDVRKSFVDFLYSALQQKGIYTFKDDEKLERGRSISPALIQAIKESRIAVIIFSENYATSSWCLEELAEIVDSNHVLGQTVLPVFYYVDPTVVRRQKGSFGRAFVKHEDEIEDKERIQKWRAALGEAASISGWDVPNTADGHESKCIQEIVGDVIAKLGRVIAVEEKNQVGIDSRVHKVNALLNLGSDEVHFIGIWGMSGIGKTTIARAVFDRISIHFEAAIFLHEVREQSKSLEILQEKILSKILCLKDLRISSAFEGSNMIRRRLCYKKVLIVLDDVDHLDQLEALAGKHHWFGAGSRIIITTKNKHLLVTHEVDRMYKVELLNEYEAIQLFSWYAFKKDYPAEDYEELSIEIVHYAGCLPLGLKVLGSFLYGRDMAEWRSEVERLKRIPEDEIMEKLKVSFNGLREVEKEIFLDIACFFKGKKKEYIRRVLDSFNFYPDIGIKVLIEKSLVTVSGGRILMHCLIQEMGWHIVRQKAPDEPGKHSRLWVAEEICDVLARDKVTENVVGMWLDLCTPKDVLINNEAFEKMKQLRLLKINNACVSRCPNCIPNEIRWLNWHGYPSKSLPESFQPEKLVGLKLQYSRIVQLWKGIKLLDKLKYINLSYSQKLIRTPDFTGIPNLERLILEDCSSLTEIHPSAGYLKRLQLFNLRNCTSLRSLPKQIILESLEVMILSGCSKVGEFPKILGAMDHLKAVYLEATAIKELPPSIEHLTSLVLLNLSYCKRLASLPSSVCRLKCLKVLILSGCSKLDELPEELGHVVSLEELYVDETAISKPPSSVVLLKNLKTLSFRGCKAMACRTWRAFSSSWLLGQKSRDSTGLVLPSVSGLNCLAKLDLSDCNLLDGGFPSDLGSLSSLVELNLGKNNFTSISAASIKNLSRLQTLELVGCKRLEILPELPPSIEVLYADNCTSLQSATDLLTKYGKLYRVSFSNCFQLLQDEQTSSMIDATWNHMLKELLLVDDNFSICLPGGRIPSWFTYQNWGPSIRIKLPSNWYSDEFMGFAVCAVSDLITTTLEWRDLLQKIPSVRIQFNLIDQEEKICNRMFTIGCGGSEKIINSEHTCLAYLSFHEIWLLCFDKVRSPNDWTCIEVSADVYSKKYMVFKAWGISLVYKDDVRQNTELSMIPQSSELGERGLSSSVLANGLKSIRKKRRGREGFSRIPPK
ncbi:TMV resistance protein N-like [Coffea arabica]|uniref:ADP-ribosyl cyclase/cyclic ADP-ribose hydrolase n=1 Tax=Coffea arabica TaxID=13443 RepID=A0A6P6TXA3_COFAR